MKHNKWTAIFAIIMIMTVLLAIIVMRAAPVHAEDQAPIEWNEWDLVYTEPTNNLSYPMDECWTVVDVNIREKPDIDSRILSSKTDYTRIIVDDIKGDWAHLKYVDAWMYAGYLTSHKPVVQYNISSDNLTSAKYAGATIDILSTMPEQIQHILKNYDIFLTTNAIRREDAPADTITLGLTTVEKNNTVRRITILANNYYLKDTIYHETGHVMDRWYAEHHRGVYFSQTEEMLNALTEECDPMLMLINPLRTTMLTDTYELFAEAYRLYMLTPEALQEKAPNTFALLDGMFGDI